MKLLLLFAAIFIAAPLAAQSAPQQVFSCSLGHKTVKVETTGKTLTYTYGAPGKTELSITGNPTSGNIYYLEQRFAGMEYQLRFKNDHYSYIVYTSEGNGRTGAAASSGLVVMQGTKTISDMSCSHHAEFTTAFDFSTLPQDTDTYSAL